MVAGLTIIGDRVTLGAVFTLLYGLIYAYSVSAGLLTFVAVTLGLMILIALVYWRFVRSKGAPGWNPAHAENDPMGVGGKKEVAS